jgi:hypothetical protein
VRRLKFIRHARDLGFSVEDIRQLLALSEQRTMSCDGAIDIADHHLRQIEGKIARLRLIRSELKRMIEACEGGLVADCRILEAITFCIHGETQDPNRKKPRRSWGRRSRAPRRRLRSIRHSAVQQRYSQ